MDGERIEKFIVEEPDRRNPKRLVRGKWRGHPVNPARVARIEKVLEELIRNDDKISHYVGAVFVGDYAKAMGCKNSDADMQLKKMGLSSVMISYPPGTNREREQWNARRWAHLDPYRNYPNRGLIHQNEDRENPGHIGGIKLGYLATVKTNFKDADFWLTRRGNVGCCGCPVSEFNKEHIGIKVNRTDILLPKFLYYWMINLYNQGYWRKFECGVTRLQNIQTKHVKDLILDIKSRRNPGEFCYTTYMRYRRNPWEDFGIEDPFKEDLPKKIRSKGYILVDMTTDYRIETGTTIFAESNDIFRPMRYLGSEPYKIIGGFAPQYDNNQGTIRVTPLSEAGIDAAKKYGFWPYIDVSPGKFNLIWIDPSSGGKIPARKRRLRRYNPWTAEGWVDDDEKDEWEGQGEAPKGFQGYLPDRPFYSGFELDFEITADEAIQRIQRLIDGLDELEAQKIKRQRERLEKESRDEDEEEEDEDEEEEEEEEEDFRRSNPEEGCEEACSESARLIQELLEQCSCDIKKLRQNPRGSRRGDRRVYIRQRTRTKHEAQQGKLGKRSELQALRRRRDRARRISRYKDLLSKGDIEDVIRFVEKNSTDETFVNAIKMQELSSLPAAFREQLEEFLDSLGRED